MMRIGRRRFVTTALASVVGSALCGTAAAGLRSSKPAIEVTPLADGLILLTGAGTNALAARGPEGVVLVDGGLEAQSAALVERALRELSARRVAMLFNTHWHPESTGANVRLGRRGTTIVAHENTKLWLGNDFWVEWEDRHYRPRPAHALPNDTFRVSDPLGMSFGGRQIVYQHLPRAHTDGDIYVFFPDANVMAIGDAIYGVGWPDIDWWTGGWLGGIVGGLDMILTVSNDDTRFVPARGPVLTRAEMLDQFEMYNVIWERMQRILYAGGGPKEALEAEPTKEFNDIMGPPEAFIIRAMESMWPYLSPDA